MRWSTYISLSIFWIFLSGVALPAQQKPSNSPASPAPKIDLSKPPPIYGEEDLGSLSLSASNLHPADPMVGEKDDYPEFTRELLQVQWRFWDPIDLYVIKPRVAGKVPAILYLYSYPSETDRFKDNQYCKRVTAGGYAAIGFVSALTGHRYHDRPMREWFVSQLPESLTESVHDVQMILRYLAERGDIDMAHVGIFGQGSGATIAILAASVEPQIRAVDALQPWGDWPTWLAKSSLIPETERATYLTPKFLAGVAALDPVQLLGRVQTKNVRLQFVQDDLITPPAVVQHIKAAAPSSDQVVEYDTKRQQYTMLGGGRAFDWIKQQVRPPAPHSENARAGDTRNAQNESVH
jgi:dienelactone hydrolase